MATRRNSTKSKKHPPAFCTTCGEVLENYCFSAEAMDVKSVIKNLAECKSNGRFKGRFCAKLFIAGTDGSFHPSTKTRTPKRKIEELKRAILAEITKEETRAARRA